MIHDYIDETYPNTNPGLVITDSGISEDIRKFSHQALWRTIPIQLAQRLITRNNLTSFSLGNGRGLVGALSAIGNTLSDDYTFEYLAYRSTNESNVKRDVDAKSVIEMDRIMGNRVFSNLDDKNRIMIEPHGPDPVLYGIRGETASDVIEAATYVMSAQSVERWMVFRTNQATGEHLTHQVRIQDLRPYMAAIVRGYVDKSPRFYEGGFVVFGIKDETSRIDCAVYEPTRQFRNTITMLKIGDEVKVHSSVRPKSRTHGLTLNLEGLEILHLSPAIQTESPICPECKKRMKSAGTGKGFKCVKCGHKDPEGTKIEKHGERKITVGLFLPPLSAQRHLTRPLSRLNMNNSGKSFDLVEKWYDH
jgi:tRNA(Ile2)-agmatinylcytidine synthase